MDELKRKMEALFPEPVEGSSAASANSADELPSFPLLYGHIELPLAVGIVGGATRVHPAAQIALKIMKIKSARQLSEVMAAVGLAQNLAAIRALVTEGIQRGHMSLHARQVAAAAGAVGAEVDRISAQLVREGSVRVERAKELIMSADS